MYLKYGNFQHSAGECAVIITRDGLYSEDGVLRAVRERWDVQGRLQAANQTQLTAALAALQSAYAVNGQDIGLYLDDGTLTTHFIVSSLTTGGTRIVRFPSFPQGKGAEYSTFRNFSLAVEAEIVDTSNSILSWVETLNFSGGGPEYGFLEPVNGLPQKQLLKQATTFKVSQRGRAVGNVGYPIPPAPIWPVAEHAHLREITFHTPKRHGWTGLLTEYGVSWSFVFESDSPLSAVPTISPL